MRKLVNGVIAVLTLLYPFAVYVGMQTIEPWQIAALLAALLAARLLLGGASGQSNRLLLLVALLYCGFAVWQNNLISLRFYPVLINLALMSLFALSLYYPPSAIERLARLQHPDLPPEGVRYTRRVTQVWCLFFLLNGTLAVVTALWCSMAWWSLYNGLIAYLLMGLLMAVEYVIRLRTQAHVR